MDDTQNTTQPQANPEPTVTPEPAAQAPQPAPAAQPVQPEPTVPATPTAPTPQPVQAPTTGGRTFYKTFSPRLMNIPFSLAIDKNRAKIGATKKGYQIPEPAMYLSDGGMFWGNVYVEVKNADPADTSIVTLADEQITAKEKV